MTDKWRMTNNEENRPTYVKMKENEVEARKPK